MSNAQLETAIEAAWDTRDQITSATTAEVRDAIEAGDFAGFEADFHAGRAEGDIEPL